MSYVHARLASEELIYILLLPIGPSEDELAVAGGRGGGSSGVGWRWRSGGRVRGVVVVVVVVVVAVVVASSYVNISVGSASLLRCGGRIRHGALLAALAFLVSIGLTTSKSMVIGRNTR